MLPLLLLLIMQMSIRVMCHTMDCMQVDCKVKRKVWVAADRDNTKSNTIVKDAQVNAQVNPMALVYIMCTCAVEVTSCRHNIRNQHAANNVHFCVRAEPVQGLEGV
jgi:hypothetical protein